MKQQDIGLILIVVVVSGFVAFMATSLFLVPKKDKQLTAQKVDVISSQFNDADKKVFNNQAVNPTKLIEIGDNANTSPF